MTYMVWVKSQRKLEKGDTSLEKRSEGRGLAGWSMMLGREERTRQSCGWGSVVQREEEEEEEGRGVWRWGLGMQNAFQHYFLPHLHKIFGHEDITIYTRGPFFHNNFSTLFFLAIYVPTTNNTGITCMYSWETMYLHTLLLPTPTSVVNTQNGGM